MSYSFSITASSKADAKSQIAAQFDQVVASQPSHAADRDAAVVVGQAFVDILVDPTEAQEIAINMYGSLSWQTSEENNRFTASNVSVTANLRDKAS